MLKNDRRYQLISKLNERTAASRVQWEVTPQPGVFQASFPNYVLNILSRPAEGSSDEYDYGIRIVNEEGYTVDEVWDPDFKYEAHELTASVTAPYPLLKELYQRARRQALGVDKAFDQLLGQLDDDIAF